MPKKNQMDGRPIVFTDEANIISIQDGLDFTNYSKSAINLPATYLSYQILPSNAR